MQSVVDQELWKPKECKYALNERAGGTVFYVSVWFSLSGSLCAANYLWNHN